ncbi:MAG: AMP-binding protein [Hyphomicrobiaceae bacterium]
MTHPSVHASHQPDKPAYIMAASGEALSYRRLDELSNQGAHLFRNLGLSAGSHIAFMMENCLDFMVVTWAAQRSGLIFTPISTYLTASEVEFILADCGARLLVVSKRHASVAANLAATGRSPPHVFVIEENDDEGPQRLPSWRRAIASMPTTPIADEATGIGMNYSSGTTGRPKGVKPALVQRHPMEPDPFMHRLCAGVLGMTENSVYLSPAPLYHAAPIRFNMMVGHLGGTSVIMEKFDAIRFLELVETWRITHTKTVPTIFVRLLKLAEEVRRNADVSSLKAVVHAAAPCPAEIKEQMIDWLGPIIYEYYTSTTEQSTSSIAANGHTPRLGRPAGRSRNAPHLAEDRDGVAGRRTRHRLLRGWAVLYHNDEAKTRTAYNSKVLLVDGRDIGHLDIDGYLYLTDRLHFVIISGGVNIYPQEVEDVLIMHPAVADVAVFGAPGSVEMKASASSPS